MGYAMKNLLPDRVELAMLGAMALAAALIVGNGPAVDLWTATLAVPLFIASAVMGLRRNWRLAEAAAEAPADESPERATRQ